MYAVLKSFGLKGLNGFPVEVEADISGGMPALSIVGLPDSAVRESGDRVHSALKNLGFKWPDRRITINLAPADVRKTGPVYDLPLLLAVLEKRVGFKLMQKDVFLNIAGGLRVTDMAMDLSVIAAVLSSNVDTPIESGWCMAGEVGLSGEVRPVSRIEARIAEAEKLGFQHIIIPKYNLQGFDHSKYTIAIHPVRKVEEALRLLFG